MNEAVSSETVVEFLETHGVAVPSFQADEVPPVDRELLLAIARRDSKLQPEQVRQAYELISSFRTWNSAYSDILASEYIRTGGAVDAIGVH